MDGKALVPFAPEQLPLDGGPRAAVVVTQAAADHLVAWDVDQRVKAVHEAGHAVAAALLGIPVTEVEITDRAGGRTELGLGSDDRPAAMTDALILDQMVVALAASAAERTILGQPTTGGAHDLEQATQLAYQRFEAGLDPDAPLINYTAVSYSLCSSIMIDAFYRAALAALEQCRERAEALMTDHAEAVLRFASTLYAARRLAGAPLDAAFADALGSSPRPVRSYRRLGPSDERNKRGIRRGFRGGRPSLPSRPANRKWVAVTKTQTHEDAREHEESSRVLSARHQFAIL